jgi:hypothetical protein
MITRLVFVVVYAGRGWWKTNTTRLDARRKDAARTQCEAAEKVDG